MAQIINSITLDKELMRKDQEMLNERIRKDQEMMNERIRKDQEMLNERIRKDQEMMRKDQELMKKDQDMRELLLRTDLTLKTQFLENGLEMQSSKMEATTSSLKVCDVINKALLQNG